MAQAGQAAPRENKVPHQGDHDRVAMLSLNADGTADQHNPELVGDKDAIAAATREQFKQQAVSAVDVAERGSGAEAAVVDVDPTIGALKDKHDAAAESAEKAADKVVDSLTKG